MIADIISGIVVVAIVWYIIRLKDWFADILDNEK